MELKTAIDSLHKLLADYPKVDPLVQLHTWAEQIKEDAQRNLDSADALLRAIEDRQG